MSSTKGIYLAKKRPTEDCGAVTTQARDLPECPIWLPTEVCCENLYSVFYLELNSLSRRKLRNTNRHIIPRAVGMTK